MKTKILIVVTAIFILSACSKVPFTGRKQMKLLPSTQMNAMAIDSYNNFLKENPLSTNNTQVQLIKRTGEKISRAISDYLRKNKMGDRIEGFNWQFNLVQNNQVNAWAMPGGKIVFYTGIMEFCRDEESVAVVMGHEIAHIIAKHGNEKMSQGLMTQLGGQALSVAMQKQPAQTQQIFNAAYGVGSQVGVMLPFSRVHEKEADRMGLIFMALAGYNPERAISFWQEMDKKSGGNPTPEFLSTHPHHDTRIKELRKHLPEAMKYYKKNKGKSVKKGNKKGGSKKIKVKIN